MLHQLPTLEGGVNGALELSGLPGTLWSNFEEIKAILAFAVRVRPLAERNPLGILTNGPSVLR
jgi:hypothetical protein